MQAASTASENRISILTSRLSNSGLLHHPIVFPNRVHFPKTSRRLPQVNKVFGRLCDRFILLGRFVDIDNWCEKVWYKGSSRNALFTSTNPKSSWWNSFFRSRWKLQSRFRMVKTILLSYNSILIYSMYSMYCTGIGKRCHIHFEDKSQSKRVQVISWCLR